MLIEPVTSSISVFLVMLPNCNYCLAAISTPPCGSLERYLQSMSYSKLSGKISLDFMVGSYHVSLPVFMSGLVDSIIA